MQSLVRGMKYTGQVEGNTVRILRASGDQKWAVPGGEWENQTHACGLKGLKGMSNAIRMRPRALGAQTKMGCPCWTRPHPDAATSVRPRLEAGMVPGNYDMVLEWEGGDGPFQQSCKASKD
jgi:hypothetical protein